MVEAAEIIRMQLAAGQNPEFQIAGGSMQPFLKLGSVVRISARVDLSPGALLLFCVEDSLVVHRLIGTEGDTFILKGDNGLAFDPPVSRAQILGTILAVDGRPQTRTPLDRVIAHVSWWHGTVVQALSWVGTPGGMVRFCARPFRLLLWILGSARREEVL